MASFIRSTPRVATALDLSPTRVTVPETGADRPTSPADPHDLPVSLTAGSGAERVTDEEGDGRADAELHRPIVPLLAPTVHFPPCPWAAPANLLYSRRSHRAAEQRYSGVAQSAEQAAVNR